LGWHKISSSGKVKKNDYSEGGCDCLGLLIGIAEKFSLKDMHGANISSLDESNYAETADGEYLQNKLSLHFKEKNNLEPGDLALFSFFNNPQHLAIIANSNYNGENHLTIIHAYSPVGAICEHLLDNKWRNRLVAVYTLI